MSDDELPAEVAALRALVADKETIAAVQMSAFDWQRYHQRAR